MIKTDAEIAADREHAERLKEQREKLSKERKDRMKELEKRSVLLAKKSDVEIAEIAKKQAIRSMAEKKLDNNSDVVKLLNSMAKRATAFTIRDQQLEEKERLAKIEKEYDQRMDVMIEIDRVQDIMRREEEERMPGTGNAQSIGERWWGIVGRGGDAPALYAVGNRITPIGVFEAQLR